jgi:hypothetical protein
MANDEVKLRQKEQALAAQEAAGNAKSVMPGMGGMDIGGLINQIGQPGWEQIMTAAALAASIPDHIRQAAQSSEWAPEVLFYSLLDADSETREQQLLLISSRMGADSESQVRSLLTAGGVPGSAHRLPLLELAFPALKRRPPEFVSRVLDTVQGLVELDGRIDVFEYLLARLITQHLWESQNPHRARLSGNLGLSRCSSEASRVLAVLAGHGEQEPELQQAAFEAGINALGLAHQNASLSDNRTEDWVSTLDTDLPKLDRMRAADKQILVNSLLVCVMNDQKAEPQELELLRVVCSLIHVPLPVFRNSH